MIRHTIFTNRYLSTLLCRLIEETLDALLGESADPVAAGYHLRELVQTKPEEAAGVFTAVAEKEASIRVSDPAIVGGLLLYVCGIHGYTHRKDCHMPKRCLTGHPVLQSRPTSLVRNGETNALDDKEWGFVVDDG